MSYFGDAAFGITSPTTGGNSSTTPLSSGATFTGTWEENAYPEAMVSCQTDNGGTLYFDFSVDGTNSTTFPVNGFSVASGIHEFHVAVKGPRQMRVRLVNDTGAQTYLRLFTYYGTNFTRPNAPVNQSMGRDSDAGAVRVYADPQDEITLGQRSGVTPWNKFAHRPDLDTTDGDALIIADSTTNSPEILTTGETFSIAFNDTTDGAGTTGATELYIPYLDDDGLFAVGVHTLSGTSPDTTSFSGLGINRTAVSASGSNNVNANDITITSSTTGGVHAFIPAGEGVTQQALFHVPSNGIGVAKMVTGNVLKLSGGGTPRVTIKGWVHNRAVDSKYEIFRHVMDTTVENSFVVHDPINFALSSSDIIYFTASTSVSNTTIGNLRFSLNVYENN